MKNSPTIASGLCLFCRKRHTRATTFLALALLAAGCQTVHVRDPLPNDWAGNDPHARSEFWYAMARRPVISNDEAFHAILLYLDSADAAPDYLSRVRELRSRGMLPRDFGGERDAAADRGTVAVALARALRIQGGLTMRLTGLTPRYAVRALEFRGIYPPSSPNQLLTGGMFVGVMQKAEEFELGSPADAPAALLPSQARHPGGPLAANLDRPIATDQPSLPAPGGMPSPFGESFRDTFASTLPPPESLDLTFIPLPPLAIYLDEDFEAPGDSDADAVPSEPAAPSATTAPAPAATTSPTTSPRKSLSVIVGGVEGDCGEVRRSAAAPWEKCHVGMVLSESAEFRTGPRSAIQFFIPPDQTFCLDSDGAMRVLDAAARGKKVSTDVGLERGRVRYDLARPINAAGPAPATQPVQIEESGLDHDACIRSPHSALALRGTKVSLFEQEGFDPEAISLTGRALYRNTRGQTVPFGARRPATIHGAQTSAVQQAISRSSPEQTLYLSRTDFETRELAIVIQHGGFVVGDVVVGNLHLSDFPLIPGTFSPKLPGPLDFVLSWTGTPQSPLNDLNLVVYSPLHTATNPDFVANPPFIYSLNPNSPASRSVASQYPNKSRSGGRITKNSIGPDGLEIAYWPKGFPTGPAGYTISVFDLVNAKTQPTTQTNPVPYNIEVYLNGTKIFGTSHPVTIGMLQSQFFPPLIIPPPASPAATISAPAAHTNDALIAQTPPNEPRQVSAPPTRSVEPQRTRTTPRNGRSPKS